MEDREENIDYENEQMQATYAGYSRRPVHSGFSPTIHPYYLFRPGFLEDRMQIHQGKYGYPGEQENQFYQQIETHGYSPLQVDQERIKSIWKKERNRIAAKRCREKRIARLKELERKEHAMIYEISELKEAIHDYDNILEILLRYIQGYLDLEIGKHESFVSLFDRLCNLKKVGTPNPTYLRDVSHFLSKKLNVTNEGIDKITEAIRGWLNKLFEKD
ncbi:leucine zipper domain-containing protein [Encephalitozoon romaleae SJ-2008]|uniref:Leucine zipper domain-containing protein n=1 Tax=Encephalitozoon romaleae (strain SJ-2008) TaxID=1178016 RepID=I6ZT27_ENCRO|nr:leucine zipper domain-containing protein [Encephalitozoon romaleae SJ-2008]AFN82766.1 leucine zipper domain-containing protein [Encephalitozoon romaleae SJ-2008]